MKNILVILALLLTGCSQESAPAKQPESYSLEHQFAIVNVGHVVPESDPSIVRAKELLSRASNEYSESSQMIADMSVKASKMAKEQGVEVSPMEVLEATTLSHASGSKYPETASMYVVLRIKGMPHAEAMMATKGGVKCLGGRC